MSVLGIIYALGALLTIFILCFDDESNDELIVAITGLLWPLFWLFCLIRHLKDN